ncbi:MAG TPA: VCBS repeat-containing protein [Gammaproteobacteria bacterium]|nr:VCBS repeat-containing protein [Gammaproteobacteria bacterium]
MKTPNARNSRTPGFLATVIAICFISACSGGGGGSAAPAGGSNASSKPRVTIAGTLNGNNASVTLSLNGVEETFTSASFTFANDLAQGDLYSVTFVSTPANQQCIVTNGTGIANTSITDILVTCNDPITSLVYPDAEITGSLASGDFDGDSLIDLVFTIRTLDGHPSGPNNEMLRVTYGNGAGGFSGIIDIFNNKPSDGSNRGHVLISGEFNSNSPDDFALSTQTGIKIYSGAIDRNHMAIFTGTNFAGSPLYSLDKDGDNDLDLVALNFDPVVYQNDSGDFSTAQIFDSPLIGTSINMITGDFNGDGREDILEIGSVTITDIALALFMGNAEGSFDLPVLVETLSSDLFSGGNSFDVSSKELAAGDFDGDGDLDIAITSTTNFVQIMINNGAGSFSAGQRVIVGVRPVHVRVADFDLDGIADLATINQDSKTANISPGNGDGTFVDNTAQNTRSISIPLNPQVVLYDMNVQDIDNDGYQDIIFAEDGTNPPDTGRGSVQIIFSPGKK